MKIPISDLLIQQESILRLQRVFKSYLSRKHTLLALLAQLSLELESKSPNIPYLQSLLNGIHHPSPQVQSRLKELKLKLASLEYVYVDVLDSQLIMMDEWEVLSTSSNTL